MAVPLTRVSVNHAPLTSSSHSAATQVDVIACPGRVPSVYFMGVEKPGMTRERAVYSVPSVSAHGAPTCLTALDCESIDWKRMQRLVRTQDRIEISLDDTHQLIRGSRVITFLRDYNVCLWECNHMMAGGNKRRQEEEDDSFSDFERRVRRLAL